MKTLLRNIVLYAFSLWLLQYFFSGVTVTGGIASYLIAGIILTLLFFIIKPILSIIAFPINIVTLGIFSIFINTFILYLATILFPQITITGFATPQISYFGFIIPKVTLNVFFAYLACSVVVSCVVNSISWLFET